MSDWIGLAEAAYDLEGDPQAWLERLVRTAQPLLDHGRGVTAQIVRNDPADFAVEHMAALGDPAMMDEVRRSIATASPEAIDAVYRSGVTAATMSEVVFSRVPGSAQAFADATGGRVRDVLGIVAYTGAGRVIAVNAPLPAPRLMHAVERRRWTRAATHVGAGLRLRHLLDGAGPAPADAVLSPDGRVLDAQAPAQGRGARERLRHAVRAFDRARGRLRHSDPDQALGIWEGLVQGRWSLLDRFESDGRRFVVAVRNAPRTGDPRGLTEHELRVMELVGLGRPAPEIGYVLGISESAVNNAIARVKRKLGLRSRAEAAAFFAPNGLRTRLAAVTIADQAFAVGSYGEWDRAALDRLTAAEREVALLLLQGATNRAIAAQRNTSENTVANQIKAIFDKLQVASRAELSSLLCAAGR